MRSLRCSSAPSIWAADAPNLSAGPPVPPPVIDPVLRDAETKMAKSVEHFGGELTTIRTGRANPALIDRIMVPYYGTPTPLNQLAQISVPEARLLVVNVYDKSQIGAVEKALRTGDQGFNPANDGSVIRVPIPPLTEERRKEYVRLVRQKAEDARVAIRNVRRDEIHRLDQMSKKGEVSEDDAKRANARLQKITESQVERVDALAARKEAEVMEV
jgi:ribosome recycling factor